MRKLPWTDPQVFQWAVTSLVQIWNVKFNNVHCVANLLAGLKPYQVLYFFESYTFFKRRPCKGV
jgi:hypothetical protein